MQAGVFQGKHIKLWVIHGSRREMIVLGKTISDVRALQNMVAHTRRVIRRLRDGTL